MITRDNERMSVGGGFLSVEEFYGLSTDTKPTNTANGSTFFEMDTGKMYRFNYTGGEWVETTHYGAADGFGPAPSGGGGGGGGGVLVVHATWGDTPETEDTCTLDKTWNEITAAAQIGPVCIIGTQTIESETIVDFYVFSGTSINENISGNTWLVNAFLVFDGVITGYTFETDSADGYPTYTYEGD